MKNEVIVQRGNALKSNRSAIENTWELIERYFAPFRGNFFRDGDIDPGGIDWRRPWVYDSTGANSSQTLSSSLHSSLTSSASQFFAFRFRQEALNEDNDCKVWLEECGKQVYYALQDSNFAVEINETYQDLVNYGTSVICEESEKINGRDELVFSSVPLKQVFFEQDARGNLLNFFRRMQKSGLELWSQFGDDLPESILEAVKSDGYDDNRKYVVWFCVFRRMGVEYDTLSTKVLGELERPFGYKYVLENEPSAKVGKEGGYYEMPAFIPRWKKTSDSVWGNSPAMVALSDNLTLQRLIELSLAAIEKAIDPPTITTQRGLIGDLNLQAGGLTTVRDMKELAPFNSNARFDVQQMEITRLQANIKDYFFINQLMLPPMQGSPATATEISARVQQLERIFGPTLARIQTDLLTPALTRTFRILLRADRLPAMPKKVADLKGNIDIEYLGSLAKSQEATNLQGVERWVGLIGNASQIHPEMLDIPNWDNLGKGTANMLGVPARFINSNAEIVKKREETQAQQQMMMQAKIAEQAGKANEALGKGKQAQQEAGGGEAADPAQGVQA